MKFTFIKSEDKEEVIIYAKEKNDLINSIENMCNTSDKIIGYYRDSLKELNIYSIECFITLDNKIYALTKDNKYLIKRRLYELYELLSDNFVYINQGCLANVNMISHFDLSLGGTMKVVFKSGYKDYVSRRQIKNIKERLGIK